MIAKKIFQENPVLVGIAGLCPTIAVTTSVLNGLVLGAGTLLVLLVSGALSHGLKKWIPEKFAPWFHIVIAAALTSMVQLLVDAFLPDTAKSLGIFIGLIAVNCIVVDSLAFVRHHGLAVNMKTLLGIGLGFLGVLVLMGSIREIFGSGSWLGMQILANGPAPNSLLMVVPGGLLLLSGLTATAQWIRNRSRTNRKGAVSQ